MKNQKPESSTSDSGEGLAPSQRSADLVLYHGSPVKIDDRSMASGTWFTEDLSLAREYGEYVYRVELSGDQRSVVSHSFEEHWVSHGHIPMDLFIILPNTTITNPSPTKTKS